MTDYSLHGLSTRSFEQLVQALAATVISPGLVIFGDGPDGGREATYEGSIPYPTVADPWDGYLVVQAKFRQVPESRAKDAGWALAQLKTELKEFLKPGSPRRSPDYYLFVTNVDLSSSQSTGTKDQGFAILEAAASDLGLSGYDIWDYRKLCALIDGAASIRHAYAAWITPGDVLAELVDAMAQKTPQFLEVLTNFLQKQLLEDEYANLEQAGRAADERIPLGRVFVDVAAFDEPLRDPPAQPAEDATGFLKHLLELAAFKLDSASQRARRADASKPEEGDGPIPGRLVLIGGPGQGKTTVGQFACQLFRASVLQSRPREHLSAEARTALTDFQKHCASEGLTIPTVRRFPIRVELNKFAAALAGDPTGSTLLKYLVRTLSAITGMQVDIETFRAWLQAYPWLFVLDGLDEVPASTNRDDVLRAIRDFWVDVAQPASDVLVLATTRPQGYNDDFSSKMYHHKWLAPLSTSRAVHYAHRLVETRFAGDEERRAKIMSRLGRAARTPATARLMRSPLQVTIMTTLVDRMGQPPQERWSLFSEYYNVIYQREVERDIPAAEVLRDYKPDIDAIHRRVGLLLQVESEHAAHTDAKLPARRLGTVVEGRLAEEGHGEPTLADLKNRITSAAAERLVFLVGLEAGEVGFEIRSLQEFMAAEALMDAGDTVVADRLRAISAVPAWRNVFLFAAGKCFAERQHLRDTVYTICAELNDDPGDALARTALVGGLLALDLLEDGPPRRQPKYAELLVRQALRLLRRPPGDIQRRVAMSYEPTLERVFREEVAALLASKDFFQQLGAWNCIIALADDGVPFAKDVVNEKWPTENADQEALIDVALAQGVEVWAARRIEDGLAQFTVSQVDALDRDGLAGFAAGYAVPQWIRDLLDLDRRVPHSAEFQHERLTEISVGAVGRSTFYFNLVSVRDRHPEQGARLAAVPGDDAGVLRAAGRFVTHPSMETLGAALRALARDGLLEKGRGERRVPWPLAACLAHAQSNDALEQLAGRVEAGWLGDFDEWAAAEHRWQAKMLAREDIMRSDETGLPFDAQVGHVGFPVIVESFSITNTPEVLATVSGLVSDWYKSARTATYRSLFAGWRLFLLGVSEKGAEQGGNDATLPADTFCSLLREALGRQEGVLPPASVLNRAALQAPFPDSLHELLEEWGRRGPVSGWCVETEVALQLLVGFTKEQLSLQGLRRLFALGMETAPVAYEAVVPFQVIDDEPLSLIRLKTGWADTKDVVRLAQAEDPVFRTAAISALLEVPVDDGIVVSFERGLPGGKWREAREIARLPEELLSRRTSGLEDEELWARLKLFERVAGEQS